MLGRWVMSLAHDDKSSLGLVNAGRDKIYDVNGDGVSEYIHSDKPNASDITNLTVSARITLSATYGFSAFGIYFGNGTLEQYIMLSNEDILDDGSVDTAGVYTEGVEFVVKFEKRGLNVEVFVGGVSKTTITLASGYNKLHELYIAPGGTPELEFRDDAAYITNNDNTPITSLSFNGEAYVDVIDNVLDWNNKYA